MNIFSQEFAAGAIMIVLGTVFLKLQQFEWYRDMMFSGHWKSYNTPGGRRIANVQCVAIILLGFACCAGFLPFNR